MFCEKTLSFHPQAYPSSKGRSSVYCFPWHPTGKSSRFCTYFFHSCCLLPSQWKGEDCFHPALQKILFQRFSYFFDYTDNKYKITPITVCILIRLGFFAGHFLSLTVPAKLPDGRSYIFSRFASRSRWLFLQEILWQILL